MFDYLLIEEMMLSYKIFRDEYPKQTCQALVGETLQKIEQLQELNIFITVCADEAMAAAKTADEHFANNTARPLEGMLVAVKDNISTKDILTTCASKILENFVPVYDATAITLLKKAGAIIIGKTNMDEFAMGSSNETSHFGNVLNPHDTSRVPGGSSGGSAAAVAAGLCHVALGSDTGGSVRQPAAFCGTYGIKPTYGRISRYGLVAFASSLDQIGIFASTPHDTALVLDTITGKDKMDATTAPYQATETLSAIATPLKNEGKFKVGTIKAEVMKDCDESIQNAYKEFLNTIKEKGGELIEIDFENPEAWVAIYQIIATAEASSNLSRFDGIRYGFRAETEAGEDFVTKTRSLGFGSEVKRRILLGTYVLSSGYYDAYYNKALKARRMVYNNYNNIFDSVDFIAMPTTPTPAFKFGEKSDNPIAMYLSDYFTAAANLAGIPAISIPFGTHGKLPIGMQLQAPPFKEVELMQLVELLG